MFSGVRFNSINSSQSQVDFDNITVNIGDSSLAQNGSFITERCGLFFLQILADVPNNTDSLISVTGVQPPINIARNRSMYYSTMYSNGIRRLESDQSLSIFSTASSVDVDVLKLSFFGFSLDRFLSPLIAFDVASSQPWNINSTVPFDQVRVNEGNGWNSQTNEFIPPKKGYYFLSFSIGLPSQPEFTTVALRLTDSNIVMEADIDFTSASSTSNASLNSYPDVVSWSLVYSLFLTHRAHIKLFNGGLYSDPHNLQTSFRGFYYSPRFTPSAAWYLFGNSMYLDVCQPQPIGFITVIKSNVKLLTQGKYLQVQVAGVYIIMINSNTLVGADYGLRLQVNLNGNTTTLLAVRYDLGVDDTKVGGISRSGSMITSLRIGDLLTVSQAKKSCIFFSIMTTFGGILLLPS